MNKEEIKLKVNDLKLQIENKKKIEEKYIIELENEIREKFLEIHDLFSDLIEDIKDKKLLIIESLKDNRSPFLCGLTEAGLKFNVYLGFRDISDKEGQEIIRFVLNYQAYLPFLYNYNFIPIYYQKNGSLVCFNLGHDKDTRYIKQLELLKDVLNKIDYNYVIDKLEKLIKSDEVNA